MRRFGPVHHVTFYLVVVLYFCVRIWGITDSCLWFDEIFSVHAAQHAWSELFSFVALDLIHPPLFYAFLKVWIAVGGEGLLWVRLLPVLFSLIAIVPFVFLCGELKVKLCGQVFGLLLLATNGSLIKYSQEVRMYTLLMCLSLFSLWLFVRLLNRGVGIAALAIVNMLMVYTHYFGWFVIAAEVAAVVIYKREKLRQVAAMSGVVLGGFLPWALAVWNAAEGGSALGQNIGWMTRPTARGLFEFIVDLIEPFYYQASSIDTASDFRVSTPLLLIVAVVLIAYFSKSFRRDAEKGTARLLGAFVAVPVVIAFVASWILPYSIWGTRHLIIIFPPAALLIAVAVTSLHIPWLRTAAVTLMLLFAGFALFRLAATPARAYSWCNWESQGVHAVETFPEKIYVLEDIAAYHVWFALRQSGQTDVTVAKIRNIPGVAEDSAYFLPRGFDEVRTVDLDDVRENKFWLGYRAARIDQTQQPLKTFIDAGYKVVAQSFLDAEQEQTIFLLLEKGN